MAKIVQINKVLKAIRTSKRASSGWSNCVPIISGSSSKLASKLRSFHLEDGSVTREIEEVLMKNPIEQDASFLYFGIAEFINARGGSFIGVSSFRGSGKQHARKIRDADLLPDANPGLIWSDSKVNRINRIKKTIRDRDSEYFAIDYLAVFAATALLIKHSCKRLRVNLPIYVGFNCGDFFRVG